jgi:threonine dehydratase
MTESPGRAPLTAPTLGDIESARDRLRGAAIRTPLVRFNLPDGSPEIWLKLECLQPIGSFKLRGAFNAMSRAGRERIAGGVYTASAGNMAQGLAWSARRMGVPCRVVVPETAPAVKLAAIERLGGTYVKAPFARWWQTLVEHSYPGIDGLFVHPVSDPDVIAGNATIGLEIVEDVPDVSAVVVPFGGGGLSCGIAAAVRTLRPGVPVFAAEVETAAPFAASLAARAPAEIDYVPSFVDGIGGRSVLTEMWPLASTILAGSLVVSLKETAAALKLLAERNRVIAEGAGAVAVAAALSGRAGRGKVVCVVSGGNIDSAKLCAILKGEVP